MTPRPDISALPEADPALSYVRRVLPDGLFRNQDTGQLEIIPQKVFVFNPDLSIHQEEIILSLGSTVPVEYVIPPNGALTVPVAKMVSDGAFLRYTPHTEEPILGPAHHSVFGKSLTPSKTDKANMRDVLLEHCTWITLPAVAA